LESLPYLSEKNYYFVFQREVTEKGYQHRQRYIVNSINRFTLFRCHVEARKWSQAQTINYCKKKKTSFGETYERGIPKRTSRNSKAKKEREKISYEKIIWKISKKIQKGKYKNFFEIEEDAKEFFQEKMNSKRNFEIVKISFHHLKRDQQK
jgi:hypothetical protein